VLNNPVKYTDPTGHVESCGMDGCGGRGAIQPELPGWREAGAAYEEYMRAKYPSDPSQFNPDLVDAHWRAFQGMYTEARNSMPWSHWSQEQLDAVQNEWMDAALIGLPGSTSAIEMGLGGLLGGVKAGIFVAGNGGRRTLFHYTNEKGLNGILKSEKLLPSTSASNPNDVRYGNGQYLSDIEPGSKTPAQLSRAFLNVPYRGDKYTHYVEIDVTGLDVVEGRTGVYVIPNEGPLNLAGRIISFGRIK
jgi:hypothetical protein